MSARQPDPDPSPSPWAAAALQFRRNSRAMAGLGVIVALSAVALSADLLAGNVPLMLKWRGGTHFPAVRGYAVAVGLATWPTGLAGTNFKDLDRSGLTEDEWMVFPPIPFAPNETNLAESIQAPSRTHWMGTDLVGRDIASRMVHGTRISLSVGFVAVSIYVLIGLIVGASAGYYGGGVDLLLARLIEVMQTIPVFFLILTLVAFLPQNILTIMVVIGLTGWTTVARLVRGEVLRTRALDFVMAARAAGSGHGRTIVKHVLPNALAPVFVAATFGVGSAILLESSLSFLGFGVPPSTPSWGSILSSAREFLPSGWWMTTFPGVAIFLTVTAYNLVGEGLRDAIDPRVRDPQ